MMNSTTSPPRIEVTEYDQSSGDLDALDEQLDSFIDSYMQEKEIPADSPMDNKISEEQQQSEEKLTDDDLDKALEDIEKGQMETNDGVDKEVMDENSNGKSDVNSSSTTDTAIQRNSQTEPFDSSDPYEFTKDQQRAMMELENMMMEGMFGDEPPPPEYNVTERLKQLNEDLANDPTPLEDERESKVNFKENLVDLVVPPPDYPEIENMGDSPRNEASNVNKSNGIIVEKDGVFNLVSAGDVKANSIGLEPINQSDIEASNNSNNNNKNNNSQTSYHQPAPPSRPRPATANGSTRRNVRSSRQQRRPQSATDLGADFDISHYKSPYAMTEEERRRRREEMQQRLAKDKEDEKRRKNQDEENERVNDDAFKAWLRSKQRSTSRERNPDDKDEEKAKRKKQNENEELFKSWLNKKGEQHRREKLLKKREQEEIQASYTIHPRDECDKAFKQWLKKKNSEIRRAQSAERQRNRYQRIVMRRSRRSQSQTRAMKQSQSYRYVDYYGYRM